MDKTVRRYYQLKKKQKEIEQELAELRQQIMQHCSDQGVTEFEMGNYRVKIIAQDRRDYDDNKLYEALPDAGLWRLISRADSSKISGLVKMNIISDEILKDAYTLKKVSAVQVERK